MLAACQEGLLLTPCPILSLVATKHYELAAALLGKFNPVSLNPCQEGRPACNSVAHQSHSNNKLRGSKSGGVRKTNEETARNKKRCVVLHAFGGRIRVQVATGGRG